jgi:putative toxin-antitoxin system antitoxin component (TIGR02293 family)
VVQVAAGCILPLGIEYLTLCLTLAYPESMREATAKALRVAFSPTGSRRAVRFRGRGASLGLGTSNTAQLIEHIERGFSFATLRTLEANSGLALSLLASIIGIPERTLARRKIAGRLAPDESERLLRISNLFEKCVELFEGDVAAAANWLTTPKQALNREPPLRYARTEFGARRVEDLIGRLEHGVFS